MSDEHPRDVESTKPKSINHFVQVLDQGVLTDDIRNSHYHGAGTEDNPYIVTWIDHDPRNPMLYSAVKKWTLVLLVAIATLAVSFVSSAYSGGTVQIIEEFHLSEEVSILGISLFVLGFAIGPLLWAPLSGMMTFGLPQRMLVADRKSMIRAVWKTVPLLRDLHGPHCLQRWRCGLSKCLDFDHPSISGWCFWK